MPKSLSGIRDSKILLPEKRLKLYHSLRAEGVAFAIGWASNEEIDRLNILQACFLAMRRALEDLTNHFDIPDTAVVVVDGNQRIPGISLQQKTVIKGDNASFAIAAASVAAKVVRDRWMARADFKHPGYDLAANKGYGGPDHLAALKKLGPSSIHRRSFAPCSAPAVFA